MEKATRAFFDVLSVSLGHKKTLERRLNREEWFAVYEIARKHSVIGPLSVVFDILDDDSKAPQSVCSRWMSAVETVKKRNETSSGVSRKFCVTMSKHGFRTCVLNGAGIAVLYPHPELRQCGNVDVWVEGGISMVLPYLRTHFKVKDVVYYHCSVSPIDGVPVKVYFMPTWLNSFSRDRKLQKWFDVNSKSQFRNIDAKLGSAVPTPVFNAVFCLVHLLRHILTDGAGLRPLMDYYYVLRSLTDADRHDALQILESFGLGRFSAAVTYVLQRAFGLEDEYVLFSPDPVWGRNLLEELMITDNDGKIVAYFERLIKYFRICPSEMISAPAFRFWQFLWLKKYNY